MTKIDHKKVALKPENIYISLHRLESHFDDIFDMTNSQNNNVVKIKDSTVNAIAAGITKYPYRQKVSKRVASTLSYEQQAELHLIALRAYMDIFHIDEWIDYWNHYGERTAERELALQRCRADGDRTQNGTGAPLQLDKLTKCLSKPFNKHVNELIKTGHIHRLDVMYTDKLWCQLEVNAKQHRNDEKFVDLIGGEMKKLRTKFDALFPPKTRDNFP